MTDNIIYKSTNPILFLLGDIGEIEYVEDSTSNTIFCVDDKLIPATEDFIEGIDPKERVIYMKLPEGLLDL